MADVSKAVLVTGCSTGIGRATAEHLARKGRTVYATARRVEAIEDLAEAGCRVLSLDVTDEESMTAAVKAVEAEEGAVGVLVNNAGYSQGGAVESLAMEDVQRQFDTNVFGPLRLVQLCLPGMRAQRFGRIVNVSSVGGSLVFPGGGAYHASKWALEAFSDALRNELRHFGVSVSIVKPGVVKTAFREAHSAAIGGNTSDPVWGEWNAKVDERVSAAYDAFAAKLGATPKQVAKAIEHAGFSRRPRTRYRVGTDGRSVLAMRRTMPDRAFDFVIRTQFPEPPGR